MEAAQSRLHLRAQQICAGTHHPHHDGTLRDGGRLPPPLQRLWAGAGAFEPLYRRAGNLRIAAAEWAEADDLRRWRAAPRLCACERRGARLRGRTGTAAGGRRHLQYRIGS